MTENQPYTEGWHAFPKGNMLDLKGNMLIRLRRKSMPHKEIFEGAARNDISGLAAVADRGGVVEVGLTAHNRHREESNGVRRRSDLLELALSYIMEIASAHVIT